MWRKSHDDRPVMRAFLPALAVCVVAYFTYHTLEGRHGLRSYFGYKSQIAELSDDVEQLATQRASLQRRVDMLDPKKPADPDLVDEEVRRRLGYVGPDEFVIKLPEPKP
jgi:cell division protein FtsB